MAVFLGLIAALAYLITFIGVAAAIDGTDIQWILAGIYATCGTVAAAGAAIVARLDTLKRGRAD